MSNKIVLLDNVKVYNIPVDIIIFYISLIFPFINEFAIVLTKSGIPTFNNFYKVCIPDEIIEIIPLSCKKNTRIQCSSYDTLRRIFIDLLAYLGIILNIGRNTIKYGYITGVVNGFVLIMCSIIFPNLYLSVIIHKTTQFLNINSPIIIILLGLFYIIILIIITQLLQKTSIYLFKNYRIDKLNEPVVNNKIEQSIINWLE